MAKEIEDMTADELLAEMEADIAELTSMLERITKRAKQNPTAENKEIAEETLQEARLLCKVLSSTAREMEHDNLLRNVLKKPVAEG